MPPYFTTDELRARYPDLTEDKYADEKVESYRVMAEEALEQACKISFVPREATETVRRSRNGRLRIPRRAVRSISTAVDSDDETVGIDDIDIDGRWITNNGGWPTGRITVTYTHGLDEPPGEAKLVCMALTKAWMVKGPIDDRATQQINTETGGTINLATPGMFGQRFGIPAVDAFVRDYKRRSYVR